MMADSVLEDLLTGIQRVIGSGETGMGIKLEISILTSQYAEI